MLISFGLYTSIVSAKDYAIEIILFANKDGLQQSAEKFNFKHIDFSNPYDQALRENLIKAAELADIDVFQGGVYGATQGPRLETAAEINKLERDGCDIVGMTGMPEAALARELEMGYAHCAMSVNWAAGRSEELITLDSIRECTEVGMEKVRALLAKLVEVV